MYTYSIKTLGCKANQYESSVIESALNAAGLTRLEFGKNADIVIVNTCTVTDNSDKKCRNYIRQGARMSAGGGVIVTGCLSRREESAVAEMDGVLAVVDNKDKGSLARRILESAGLNSGMMLPQYDEAETISSERSRAYIKIQDGCDGECSYCIVPRVRGLPSSRPFDDIVIHAKNIIAHGIPEIVLTGITIGKYLHSGKNISALIRELSSLPGDFRLRLTSIEPLDCTDELIALYASGGKLSPHIHLPLQSGSDRILSAMKRPYTAGQFIERIHSLHAALPGISIGSDMIVGFPGEDDDDFAATIDVVRSAAFSYVHQFAYSQRSGTAASSQKPCAGDVIRARSDRLRTLSHELSIAYRKQFEGQIVMSVPEKGGWALTPHYLKVKTNNTGLSGLLPLCVERVEESGAVLGRFITS